MRAILFSRKGLHYESSKRGEALVMYVPSQEDPRVYRDLEGKGMKEIAERYGSAHKKPLIRENHGEIEVYGLLEESLAQRRHSMKVFLPQDIAPPDTTVFYYMLGKKYIVHGVKTITDEGETRWGSTLIILQGGDPVKIIMNAISERMLDGDEGEVCVAVDGNLDIYEALKNELKPLNLHPIPFEALKLRPKVVPLYAHKDYSFLMVLAVLMAMILAGASGAFWMINKLRVEELQEKIVKTRREIQNIQNDKLLGHIVQPRVLLAKMERSIQRRPSAYLSAATTVAADFGAIEAVEVKVNSTRTLAMQNANTLDPDKNKIIFATAKINLLDDILLVDQETLAKTIVDKYSWLRMIESNDTSLETVLLSMGLQVTKEEDPNQ